MLYVGRSALHEIGRTRAFRFIRTYTRNSIVAYPGRQSGKRNTLTGLKLLKGKMSSIMKPKEGITRNHRHDEPLFVLSMTAQALGIGGSACSSPLCSHGRQCLLRLIEISPFHRCQFPPLRW